MLAAVALAFSCGSGSATRFYFRLRYQIEVHGDDQGQRLSTCLSEFRLSNLSISLVSLHKERNEFGCKQHDIYLRILVLKDVGSDS